MIDKNIVAEYDFETFVESITDVAFRAQRTSELKKIKNFDELKIYTKNSIETGMDKYQGLLVEICFEKAESLDATQNPAQILNYMTTNELYKIKASLLSEKSKNAIDEIINGRLINNKTKTEEKPD